MHLTRSDRRRRWLLRWRSLLTRFQPGDPLQLTTNGTVPEHRNNAWQRLRGECGVPDGVRLSLTNRRGDRVIVPLCDPYTLIGRGSLCTVRLDDPTLSPLQAALVWAGGRLFLVDAGRTSVVPVDALPRAAWTWCAWTAAVEGLPVGHDRPRHPVANGEPCPELVWDDDGPLRPLRLVRPLTVLGSAAACTVRLSGPGVAPLQAALVRCDAGLWLIDLAGDRSTQINDRPIGYGALDPDDRLQFGPVSARLSVPWPRESVPVVDRLAEFRTRITALEARLAALRQRLNDAQSLERIEQQLMALQQFAGQCEQLLDAGSVAPSTNRAPHAGQVGATN